MTREIKKEKHDFDCWEKRGYPCLCSPKTNKKDWYRVEIITL